MGVGGGGRGVHIIFGHFGRRLGFCWDSILFYGGSSVMDWWWSIKRVMVRLSKLSLWWLDPVVEYDQLVTHSVGSQRSNRISARLIRSTKSALRG